MNHSHNRIQERNISTLNVLLLSLFLSVSASQADTLAFFNPDYTHTDPYTISFQSFVANDPVSLEALFDDWASDFDPKKGNNIALESSRFDMGIVMENNYYIGYTYRHDVFIEASHDFVRLMYLSKNKLDLPVDEQLDLSLTIDGFDAQGIVLGKSFTFIPHSDASLSLSLSASFLYAKNMQQGTLYGDATILSTNDYDFHATSSYFYTHNYLYDLDVDNSYGLGFTTHMTLSYQYKNFSILLLLNDIFGRIYWDGLPYSYISMSSDNKYYDEDGYAHYNPAISGRETQENYTQVLPLKLHFQTNYLIEEKYMFSLGTQYMYETLLPFGKFTYIDTDALYYLNYESRFGSVTLGATYHNVSISLSADKVVDPSSLGIQISAFLDF